MRVAILSCGESLGLYPSVMHTADVVIGVNSAVEAYTCDIWCASDHNVFCDYTPHPPFPWGVFTSGPIKRTFKEMHPETDELVTREIPEDNFVGLTKARWWNKGDYEFNGFSGFAESSPDIWKRFTIGSALMLAYMLGSTEIVTFGCDMRGETDWKGEPGRRPSDRDADRWKLEREMWDLIVGWLAERGVEVERIVRPCPTDASA
jgi:hypothetical protein